MFITDAFNNIPELAHLNENQFIQDCQTIYQSANKAQAYAAYGTRTGLGPYMGGSIRTATNQENGDLMALPPEKRIRIEITLRTAANQKLVKHIDIAIWLPLFGSLAVEFNFPLQFMGYGAYSLCHFNSQVGGEAKLHTFFCKLAENHVNFHRVLLFTNGNYEIAGQPTVPLLNDANNVNPNFFKNLTRLVSIAAQYNVVVQVGLFVHQSIVDDGKPQPKLSPPAPLTFNEFGTTNYQRYMNFFNVNNARWNALQTQIILGVTSALMSNWNVVYEVGNELRIPDGGRPPVNPPYTDVHLTQWVDWVACTLKKKSYGKLVTCSTGLQSQNEAPISNLRSIDFVTFHAGQWMDDSGNTNIPDAKRRTAGYGGKHVMIDDDGTKKNLLSPEAVGNWTRAALRGIPLQTGSFDHKGPFDPTSGSFTVDGINGTLYLTQMKAAWESCFIRIRPEIGIHVPREGVVV